MNLSRTYLALLAAVAFWCLLISAPPLAALVSRSTLIPAAANRVGSAVCHQIESRSLHLGGVRFAVCARCTGIYTGFALAVLAAGMVTFRPPRRGERTAWALVLAPMVCDVALDVLGIRHASLGSRLFTGALFGAGAGILLVPLILQGARDLLGRRQCPTFRPTHELHT